MPIEIASDVQWWYSKSTLRDEVDQAPFIILEIGGMECPMEHSARGRDGRDTLSFKFMRSVDRDRWVELRKKPVNIELVGRMPAAPVIESDPDEADEDTSQDSVSFPSVHSVQRTTSTGTLFDVYLFVDWSAAARPKRGKDSVWIAEAGFGNSGALEWHQTGALNPPTRSKAYEHVYDRLKLHVKERKRVLIGFDFPYGYPNGTVEQIVDYASRDKSEWRLLWEYLSRNITDGQNNRNNRFEMANQCNQWQATWDGPFWGRPAKKHDLTDLTTTKPPCFTNKVVKEYRAIEQRMRDRRLRPMSVWQLLGNGSVGSQSLMGLPYLQKLTTCAELLTVSQVWPFECGWTCPKPRITGSPQVLHAEIWPGAIDVDEQLHSIRDAAQMMSYVFWAAKNDVDGTLAQWFNPFDGIAEPDLAEQALNEGWILGFKA